MIFSLSRDRYALLMALGAGTFVAPTGTAQETGGADLSGLAEAERCLAQTLYFEAQEDDMEDFRAVAAVVLNRVENDEFPGDICAVVQEGGEDGSCQFSWYCDGEPDQPAANEKWDRALAVARDAVDGDGLEGMPAEGALFFHTKDFDAEWAEELQRVKTTEGHVFYRLAVDAEGG